MTFNLNNPAFLQMAGNAQAKEYMSFIDKTGNPEIKLSCDGDLQIVSTYNGDEMIQTLSNISQQTVTIQSDPNTEIFIYGKVTLFNTLVFYPGGTTDISELNTLYAKSLTYLDCDFNQLTSLDVSKNTALTYLSCGSNQLTSLDVSENTALTYLDCDFNQLTSLDVSKNTALTNLSCGSDQLTSLDVSKNTALTYLACTDNQLTSLDVSKNTALTYLACEGNQLTSLDVSKNTALTYLACTDNLNITAIQSVAVNGDVASAIEGLINDATSTTGTVTLRNGDEFNSTISNAATTKGWTIEYVDA